MTERKTDNYEVVLQSKTNKYEETIAKYTLPQSDDYYGIVFRLMELVKRDYPGQEVTTFYRTW